MCTHTVGMMGFLLSGTLVQLGHDVMPANVGLSPNSLHAKWSDLNGNTQKVVKSKYEYI